MRESKIPISLLIGRGTATMGLYQYLDKEKSPPFEIVSVISHKSLDPDQTQQKTQDVPGILKAKQYHLPNRYFNYVQYKKAMLQENPLKNLSEIRDSYFLKLYEILTQQFKKPELIFLLGWDIIVPKFFLEKFPSEKKGLYNVINLHPSLLPKNPEDTTYTLSSGVKIPILKGERTQVINQALLLKLPSIGSCTHYVHPEVDRGGDIIKSIETPIYPDDDFQTFHQRNLDLEQQLVLDTILKLCTLKKR